MDCPWETTSRQRRWDVYLFILRLGIWGRFCTAHARRQIVIQLPRAHPEIHPPLGKHTCTWHRQHCIIADSQTELWSRMDRYLFVDAAMMHQATPIPSFAQTTAMPEERQQHQGPELAHFSHSARTAHGAPHLSPAYAAG